MGRRKVVRPVKPELKVNPWSISPRQKEGMEMCRARQFVLFSGPRLGGKTSSALQCVVDHAWRTDRANVSVIVVSQAGGLQSGIWKSLVRTTIPQWIDAGIGMRWERRPYIAAVSKQPACSIINAHGNISEFELHSLKHEKEVEARFKGREFTCMYVPELSNFHAQKTFSIWSECLRASHLRDDQFLFLADTNPSDDGEESWIYLQWFVIPKLSYDEYVELCHKRDLPIPDKEDFESYKASVGHLTFEIADNIFLSKARISRLIRTYDGDPDLYDRYILGLWKKASADALFAKVFRPRFHIIGEIETPANPDPEIMIPNESTSRLVTGWDPGQSVNSAFCIIEKYSAKITLPSGKLVEKSIFKVLRELVLVGIDHSLDDFTVECVKMMEKLEDEMGRKFEWEFWSDRSVFDMKDARSNRYFHSLIHEASDGFVNLRAADRSPGSIRQRVSLLRKLLFEGRIFFDNNHCPKVIEMLRSIRPGTGEMQAIQKGTPFKHIFDALTYALASELFDELDEVMYTRVRTSADKEDSGLVSITT